MIFFFETRTLTGVYLTWSSCYWDVLVLANSIMFLIKTIKKSHKRDWLSSASRFEH